MPSDIAVLKQVGTRREKDDDYPKIVVRINNDWRVIECPDGLQWILQKRYPSQWVGKKYLRDRDSLIRRVIALCGPANGVAMEVLSALPAWMHLSHREVAHA